MDGRKIEDYRDIVGDKVISVLFKESTPLRGKRILNVNSTYMGGGVAEMLWSIVPLMNDLGIEYGWRVIHGTAEFFPITKKWHNALQGEQITVTDHEKNIYTGINQLFSRFTHIKHDVMIVHDPQPLPLISFYPKRQPWIWRCHIDLSEPNKEAWSYIKKFILRYDNTVFSADKFAQSDLPNDKSLIAPAIDPLTTKNMEMDESRRKQVLEEHGINLDRPIISQVSRFDKWKDPLGVVEIFKKVKKTVDAQLVLLGAPASDDPECQQIFRELKSKIKNLDDVRLINKQSDLLVNSVQAQSDVVIQKSTREGFGLTVTEALWKGTPVVASDVGGIPLQVIDGETGFLLPPDDHEGFARKIVEIIEDDDLGNELGQKGKEHVRNNFLVTRLMLEWIQQIKAILRSTKVGTI
ncbi:glycosyltransferase [Candidatus Bipolaricaulota bacterium]|nr:glycosyltransferase [Candidatus Bipolaricaulota bacterium]